MPLVTTILDDQAPLLLYDNNCQLAGSSQSDNDASFYYLGTFSTCTQLNGAVSFTFNGTGFGIYGAKRSNHGSYAVTVDGNQVAQLSDNEPQNEEQYQQVLYSTNSLKQEGHVVSLSNAGGGHVDVDFVTIKSQVGDSNQDIQTAIIQDTDPRFSYHGQDWSDAPASVRMFKNGTGHSSTIEGSSVVLSFMGEAVSLFGSVGPNNGFYSAQLDDEPANTYNATRQILLTQVMLYHADNLGSDGHELKLTNSPQVAGQSLNIDYAEIMTLSNSSPTVHISELSASTCDSHLSRGTIAGIVVQAVLNLILLFLTIYRNCSQRTSEAA